MTYKALTERLRERAEVLQHDMRYTANLCAEAAKALEEARERIKTLESQLWEANRWKGDYP